MIPEFPRGTYYDDILAYLMEVCDSPDAYSSEVCGAISEGMFRVGSDEAPDLLEDLYTSGHLTHLEVLASAIEDAWTDHDHPTFAVDPELWMEMFEQVGYLEGKRRAIRPSEPLTLYRGATHADRAGMSWTDDLAIAQSFAYDQLRGRPQGHVWTAVVPPRQLLAHFPSSRQEAEYVADARTLDIRLAEAADTRVAEVATYGPAL